MAIIDILVRYFPSFNTALGATLKLTVISLLMATVLGVVFGLFKVSGIRPLKLIANIYIDIIRGTPLMVQTMIVFYGISQVLRPLGFSWGNIGGAYTAGAVTLSLNAGAYMAEIIRGGIEAIDKGQMEAARSLGLPYGKAMRKVILPQAFRTMMPSIINQFIISLKDTSLISIIGIRELTQNGKIIAANSASMVMAIWVVVALYYLVICTMLSKVALVVERKVSYGKQ
ncbi:MAG: amino acid ABC transporter permease [Lachnospiraceae bacterium]|nr:amino acid ABC transporter permease [Lachnospiraceae bacterium]